MSIYTKPLSQVTFDDLQELLLDQAVENVRLEFKSIVPNKEEILKKLSSFANTFGGFVVIGAKATSTNGRLEELGGVDIESGYKQKLNQWAFEACRPPLVIEVSDPIPTPTTPEKVCYVIYVPESDSAPHFLNGRKGIWVRTDEFSARFSAELTNEDELLHLLDRRNLIRQRRRAIVERSASRFMTFAAATLGSEDVRKATLLRFCVVPRFPARQLCEQERLKMFTQPNEANWIRWRGEIFPDPGAPITSQHESSIVLMPRRSASFLETNIWGLLYYGVRVDEDESWLRSGNHAEGVGPADRAIHLYRFVGYILLFARHSGKILKRMGYSGPLHVEVALAPVRQVKWFTPVYGGAYFSSVGGSELDDSVDFSLAMSAERLFDKPDGVSMEILKTVLFAMNLSNLVDSSDKVEGLIKRGYEFNGWEQPTVLST